MTSWLTSGWPRQFCGIDQPQPRRERKSE